MARLSSNSKNRENSFNNNKKSFLLKHVCETINNKKQKQNEVCFPGKQKKKEYQERKCDDEVWLE